MQQETLFPRLQKHLASLLAGYQDPPDLAPPALGPRAGVLGALALAQEL